MKSSFTAEPYHSSLKNVSLLYARRSVDFDKFPVADAGKVQTGGFLVTITIESQIGLQAFKVIHIEQGLTNLLSPCRLFESGEEHACRVIGVQGGEIRLGAKPFPVGVDETAHFCGRILQVGTLYQGQSFHTSVGLPVSPPRKPM